MVFQILFEQTLQSTEVQLYETCSKWHDLQYRVAFVPAVMGIGHMVNKYLEFVFEWSKRYNRKQVWQGRLGAY